MRHIVQRAATCAIPCLAIPLMSAAAFAADRIEGSVEAGGQAVARAEVTLWAAGPGAPRRIATSEAGDDGSFEISSVGRGGSDGVFYLIAKGPNPAVALMANLGTGPPPRVTINDLTTVASVWTAAQFLDGVAMSGNALGLRIAAGNVPNLVDLETGGLGAAIQDPLNSSQTPALAKFNTLGILLSACVNEVSGACHKLFEVTTPPGGAPPTDTLSAAQNIARHPWHRADDLFALLDEFHPVPAGRQWRDVPHIPYLN